MNVYVMPLIGGGLIGLAVSLMLLWNGRVAGVSGIVNGAIKPNPGDRSWRLYFIAGLVAGGILLRWFLPAHIDTDLNRSFLSIILSGLLVGFGTVMGGGCTSGHGICGLSRLSPRSILATITFMLFGVIAATAYRVYGGSL